MIIECISIATTFGSFPWWTGIIYPTCYLSLPMFCYGLFLFMKYHYFQEFIIITIIVIIQIIILFL